VFRVRVPFESRVWFWQRSMTSGLTRSDCIMVAAVLRRSCGVHSPFSPPPGRVCRRGAAP
jgi:hypothetical protein